jgi:hypothetical protein
MMLSLELLARELLHPRASERCANLTVKATVTPMSITANPFNHAGLRDLLMIEWE